MVQRRYLHILLPSSVHKLTVYAEGEIVSSYFILVCYLLAGGSCRFLSLSLFYRRGIQGDPTSIQTDGIFICWSLFMVAAPDPEQADFPPLSVKFWFLSDLSYELFELFVTELKFLDRN